MFIPGVPSKSHSPRTPPQLFTANDEDHHAHSNTQSDSEGTSWKKAHPVELGALARASSHYEDHSSSKKPYEEKNSKQTEGEAASKRHSSSSF